MNASIHAADDKIQQTRKALQDQKVIRKHCEVYRACRDVIRAEKDVLDKLLYRKQHKAEYQLHETTLKELAEFGIHKLPSAEKLQRQRMALKEDLPPPKKKAESPKTAKDPAYN